METVGLAYVIKESDQMSVDTFQCAPPKRSLGVLVTEKVDELGGRVALTLMLLP